MPMSFICFDIKYPFLKGVIVQFLGHEMVPIYPVKKFPLE